MSNQEIHISIHTNEECSIKTPGIRVPGIDEGRFLVPDDFDDPLPPELLKAFEGED